MSTKDQHQMNFFLKLYFWIILCLNTLIGVFPKLQVNKFAKLVKLAKTFNHWPKLWWELNPSPKIISLLLSQIANEVSVPPLPQTITSFMYYYAWLLLSNGANWVNLIKEGWIKGNLQLVNLAWRWTSIVTMTMSLNMFKVVACLVT